MQLPVLIADFSSDFSFSSPKRALKKAFVQGLQASASSGAAAAHAAGAHLQHQLRREAAHRPGGEPLRGAAEAQRQRLWCAAAPLPAALQLPGAVRGCERRREASEGARGAPCRGEAAAADHDVAVPRDLWGSEQELQGGGGPLPAHR